MTAADLYREGKLQAAIDAAVAAVKQAPTSIDARYMLAQLLCFVGDLERADVHLDAIGSQDPDRMVVVAMSRHLIRAEQARRQFFDEGRVPEVVGTPSPAMKLQLEASIHLREGRPAEAADLLAQAAEQRPPIHGTCDGQPITALRDLDDLLGGVFEILTSNGKYYWIEMERVERMELHPVESPFDLIWRRVRLEVRDGPDGEVFIPVMYANSYKETDDALRMGRATDWRGAEGEPIRGIGQRMLLVGDEDRSILEINELAIGQDTA